MILIKNALYRCGPFDTNAVWPSIDPTLLAELLAEMEAIRWPRTTQERPEVSVEGYAILQQLPSSTLTISATTTADADTKTKFTNANTNEANSKAKREADTLKRFNGIWTKAVEAIESIDKVFAQQFTALAVTKKIRGSPHIDTLNVATFLWFVTGSHCRQNSNCLFFVKRIPLALAISFCCSRTFEHRHFSRYRTIAS